MRTIQKIWKPLRSKIVSVMAGKDKVPYAVPGGSIALMTLLDPSVVKSDKLVGSVVSIPGSSPEVRYELKLQPHLLERVVGAKDKLVVEPIKLVINIKSKPSKYLSSGHIFLIDLNI